MSYFHIPAYRQAGVSPCKQGRNVMNQYDNLFVKCFRLLWGILSKLWTPWQTAAQLMQSITVKKRHKSERIAK